MKKLSQFISLTLSFLLILPIPVRGEEEVVIPQPLENVVMETELIPVETAEVVPTLLESENQSVEISEEIESTAVQETIASEMLEEAANPQEDPLQEAIEVIDEATLENEEEIIIEVTEEEVVEVPPTEEEVIEVIESETEEVAEMEITILIPTKEYTFEIDGGAIATKEIPEWSEIEDDKAEENNKEVTQAPALSVDTNTLNISGVCTDPYYVILVYRNAGDYDRDPASYIFNRAFLCENGQYSYSLSDLPFNLETGTFYLLVGGQGSRGSWKPISALTPIGITVRTIMVEASSTPNEQ